MTVIVISESKAGYNSDFERSLYNLSLTIYSFLPKIKLTTIFTSTSVNNFRGITFFQNFFNLCENVTGDIFVCFQ